MKDTVERKKEILIAILKDLGSMVVAFSGGVDSALLLALAHELVGEKVVAATAASAIHPARELEAARAFARKRGIRHIVFHTGEMGDARFISNPPDRCYHCKQIMIKGLIQAAAEAKIDHVVHGANAEDLLDFRPGLKAAAEAGLIAPLMDAKFNKDDIRFLSREMELATWNKPSMACLASRIPYGDSITEEKLGMIEKAEDFLFEKGLHTVRVRHHGAVARVEAGRDELERFFDPDLRTEIVETFLKIGFAHAAIDLEGHVSGKMNRELETNQCVKKSS